MVTTDIEQMLIFLIQSIFVFTMLKILRKITAPDKECGVKVAEDVNFKMGLFLVMLCINYAVVTFFKYQLFRKPSFTNPTNQK